MNKYGQFTYDNNPAGMSRRTDPATSHQAAEKLTGKGLKASQQKQICFLVRQFPNRTYRELFDVDQGRHDKAFHEAVQLNRRLPELEAKGMVHRGAARKCRISGNSASTWSID
jgi:hypothetical protein